MQLVAKLGEFDHVEATVDSHRVAKLCLDRARRLFVNEQLESGQIDVFILQDGIDVLQFALSQQILHVKDGFPPL